MMICLGGVCVPLNLLIPFLIGVLHRYGYLQWFKQEWVTISYWKKRYAQWTGSSQTESQAQTKRVTPGDLREKKEDLALKADNRKVGEAVDDALHKQKPS